MEVADRRQTAALSHLSRDPAVSIMSTRARSQRLLCCGGPVLIQTADKLVKARKDALAWNRRRPDAAG